MPQASLAKVSHPNKQETLSYAQGIWEASQALEGTLAERYLTSRGITLKKVESLRFHPSLKHSESGLYHPALVAKITTENGVLTGIHRTYLAPNGKGKAPLLDPKNMLGNTTFGLDDKIKAMSLIINEDFIRSEDERLIKEDIPLHARPFQIAMAWMKTHGISGNIMDPTIWIPLKGIFDRLYHSKKQSINIPPLLIGGVAFLDQFYLVNVPLGYGTFAIDPLRCIDISSEELNRFWQYHPNQIWRAIYSVADLFDIAYGINDAITRKENEGSTTYFDKACSHIINATSHLTLPHPQNIDAVVQSSCLAAELALKGSLSYLGINEKDFKTEFKHDLVKSAKKLIDIQSTYNDTKLLDACKNFPNYVESRYNKHGLSRIQLLELAMRAQFVTAEAVRRISNRDFAGTIESDSNNPPRLSI